MGRTHTLKTWPGPFAAILDGSKRFEYRRDDRGFEVGDTLLLDEWEPSMYEHLPMSSGGLTGRRIRCRVTYVLSGRFGVPDGFAVLSIDDVREEARHA